jgi:16S rRNA (guanine966-N2)-methyltransferase
MRITGGLARGIELRVPAGDAVRPATDALRQAVFSSLGERVVKARFLDLFAGSGAYGLEALSRGAASGAFVERDRRAAECLRRNLAAVCKSIGRDDTGLAIAETDAVTYPLELAGNPDLIFIDPPYETISYVTGALFPRLSAALSSVPDPMVIFEMPGEEQPAPAGWTCIKRLGKPRGRQPTAAFFRRG